MTNYERIKKQVRKMTVEDMANALIELHFLRCFDDIYEGGICERVNINFCPMCGMELRKEDKGK